MSSWSGRPLSRRLFLSMKAEPVVGLMRGEVEPPCGTPSGAFISRWNSISRGRASVCIDLDLFNLEPYEQRATLVSLAFISLRNQHCKEPVSQSPTKWSVQNWIMFFIEFRFDTTFEAYNTQIGQVWRYFQLWIKKEKKSYIKAIIVKICGSSQVSIPSMYCILLHLFSRRQK